VGPNSIALYVPMKIILVEKIPNPDHQILDPFSNIEMKTVQWAQFYVKRALGTKVTVRKVSSKKVSAIKNVRVRE
jgi:hypothetical protein